MPLFHDHFYAVNILKVAGELKDIAGHMVSFDIRATDRVGDKQGNNSTTSAFLILELNAPPTEIHLHRIPQRTDVYIFGVDSVTKELIPSKTLRESLRHRYKKINFLLSSEISVMGIRAPLPHSTEQFLKGAELAILVGALVVFLACISAIVCLCYKQRKNRRKPMPLPPGLTLGVTAQGTVPILQLPYNGHYPGPYTHMSEHSDSSESVHSPQQDRTYSYQMGEKLVRQLPTRTFNRVPDIHTRSGRAKTPITHIDDDNWQWKLRQRRESNGNITEEEEHPHICSHHSPSMQRGQRSRSKGTHWHIRNHDTENEEPRGAVRVSHFTTTQTQRPSHTIAVESSETRENVSCCTPSTRPPSPDSLEREPPRISTRRSTTNRLASDVTEL
ncbi:hypothetical protein Avbf_12205 [Armadillidium vulgare]|nr:hypothetical protein Avbf_12205 [Armadillidium vulgare]